MTHVWQNSYLSIVHIQKVRIIAIQLQTKITFLKSIDDKKLDIQYNTVGSNRLFNHTIILFQGYGILNKNQKYIAIIIYREQIGIILFFDEYKFKVPIGNQLF